MRIPRALLYVALAVILWNCLPETLSDENRLVLSQRTYDPSVFRYFWDENGLDSVAVDVPLFFLPDGQRVRADVRSRDVVLNRSDSLRIGIIHPRMQIDGSSFSEPPSDYLFLSPYGQDTIPLSSHSPSVGPIVDRTFFRVGRKIYRLASLSNGRDLIEIEAVAPGVTVPVTAGYDTRYKKVPVKDMEDNLHYISRRPGRDLLLYFWGLGRYEGRDLLRIDSLYNAIPGEKPFDIAAISSIENRDNLVRFQEKNKVSIPLYRSVPETCASLNCSFFTPFTFVVNGEGRIVTTYLSHQALMAYLETLLTPDHEQLSAQEQTNY